jgi:hypothetical protein
VSTALTLRIPARSAEDQFHSTVLADGIKADPFSADNGTGDERDTVTTDDKKQILTRWQWVAVVVFIAFLVVGIALGWNRTSGPPNLGPPGGSCVAAGTC